MLNVFYNRLIMLGGADDQVHEYVVGGKDWNDTSSHFFLVLIDA